jgi:hypothetical protein
VNRILVLAMASLLGLYACGESDQEQDQQAVRSIIESAARADPGLCEALTPRFIDRFYGGDAEKCRSDLRTARPYDDLNIERVRVRDRRATLVAAAGDSSVVFRFVKLQGDWKLDGFAPREEK